LAQSSSVPEDNNFFAPSRNKFSAHSGKVLAFSITQSDLTERCQKVMRAHVGNEENAAKRLARDLACSVGTAKNYLEGRTTPQGIHDARAMAVIPGYLALKAELAGLELALDPRHQAKMVEFMRYCQTYADRVFGKEFVRETRASEATAVNEPSGDGELLSVYSLELVADGGGRSCAAVGDLFAEDA
jgi:hypothetical protein